MSLKRLVKEYAERVRAELIDRLEQEKNADTATVKWQGFNDDGKPIVKNVDQIETARGLGNISQRGQSRLLYDGAGSVEYGRTKKAKDVAIQKQQINKPLRTRRISRNLLITADLFVSEVFALFDIDKDAFYSICYSTVRPGSKDYSDYVESGGTTYSGSSVYWPIPNNVELVVPDYNNASDEAPVYTITVGAIRTSVTKTAGGVGVASASVVGSGLNLSLSATATSSGYDIGRAVGISVAATNAGGNIQVNTSGFNYVVQPSGIVLPLGTAQARAGSYVLPFPSAVYYFQIPNDSTTNGKRIRKIDLNAIVPVQVFESRIVHNFTSRENNNLFIYSIYYVVSVDMSQELQYEYANDSTEQKDYRYIGKKTNYIVHTKLNFNTGEYDSKANVSPNTGNQDVVNGGLKPYDQFGPDYGTDGTWLLRVKAYVKYDYDLTAAVSLGNGYSGYQDFSQNLLSRFSFNPEAVWRESYPGDWLYSYRNILWDQTAAANITGVELDNFLQSSYKNTLFYRGINSQAYAGSFGASPRDNFTAYDPTGTAYEGNPLTSSYTSIENIAFIAGTGTSYLYANYFDGSVPNVPSDYSNWRTWTVISVDESSINGYFEDTLQLPDFSIDEKVLETGSKVGDRLSRYKLWFNYVSLDSIRLVSYNIVNEIVELTTVSSGYAFSIGDLIQITEDAAINGTYAIAEVLSATQFKVSLPGSSDTAATTTVATATKLPPAS